MELIGHTVEGMEGQAVEELEDILDLESSEVEPGRAIVEASDRSVFQANYLSGTCSRFAVLLDRFELQSTKEAYEKIETDFSEVLKSGQSFAVRVNRRGDHEFSSQDIAMEAGQKIVDSFEEATGETPEVDLDNPDVEFILDLFEDRAYLGVDTTGESLNSRTYLNSESRTPPILANCLLRSSHWKPGEPLIDPFCGEGVIPVEAGRIACKIPNHGRRFAFLDLKFVDRAKYAEVAERAKKDMNIHELDVRGSDMELEGAENHAESSGLNISFREENPLSVPLNSDHIVLHSPFIQQKSKRKEIAEVMEQFERRFLNSDSRSMTCFTEDKNFFEEYDSAEEASIGSMEGWVVKWQT
ncbi:MAG: THUMP domain-containing protein [Candidatus Nanohaloarchaea archaeon]|nr:THUMP domain-containing protein [Candidatus Nanohaloarchaea archaeon]